MLSIRGMILSHTEHTRKRFHRTLSTRKRFHRTLSIRQTNFHICSARVQISTFFTWTSERMLIICGNDFIPCWAYAERISSHAEHTRKRFHRTLSILGNDFIACWAYTEPIHPCPCMTMSLSSTPFLSLYLTLSLPWIWPCPHSCPCHCPCPDYAPVLIPSLLFLASRHNTLPLHIFFLIVMVLCLLRRWAGLVCVCLDPWPDLVPILDSVTSLCLVMTLTIVIIPCPCPDPSISFSCLCFL